MKNQLNNLSITSGEDLSELSTAGIWEDAGILPPPVCMRLVEILHILYFSEKQIPADCMKMINLAVNTHEFVNNPDFRVTDIKKMHSYAKCLGIEISDFNESETASKITKEIICDYIADDRQRFSPAEKDFSDKNKILEKYSSLNF